jgi:hypothetical protein
VKAGARGRRVLAHTPEDAAAIFEELCGAANVLPCATLLADAIAQAIASGGAWAVTLTRKNILLNVGPVRLLNISAQGVWFATTASAGKVPAGIEELSDGEGAILYRSVPVVTRNFTAPPARIARLPAPLRRGLSFGERYGALGEGFIEVHHLNPMANAAGERTIDPVRDLVPVCPNCHRMLHHQTPLLTPQELAALLAAARPEGGSR